MKVKNKVTQNPQFSFKLDPETKKELMQNVALVTEMLNNQIEPDRYRFRKNDIIIEALNRGLALIKKEKIK
jgi:hypothetical protein